MKSQSKHFHLKIENLENEKEKLIIIIQNLKQQIGSIINF